MTHEERMAVSDALDILRLAGVDASATVRGKLYRIRQHSNESGLLIRCGEVKGETRLTVENYLEDMMLMSASCVAGTDEWKVHRFDETTAWTLFLGALAHAARKMYE